MNELEIIKEIQSLRYEVYVFKRIIDKLKQSKWKLNMQIRVLELILKIKELN